MLFRTQNKIIFILLFCITMILSCSVMKRHSNIARPDAVNEVMSGKRTTANAAWWGFNTTDATETLQSAINSGAKKVIVPNMGKDWIVRPIKLAGNQEIIFEKGVVVTAKKGDFKGHVDCLFSAARKENIVLRGYGATLRMQKADYMTDAYEKAEWRMVLKLNSCTNVGIYGLTLKDSGGDGIYLGVAGEKKWCEDIHIKDVVCDNNYRQGISVISVDGLLIEDSAFNNTGGIAPRAGIDLEPNYENERLTRCIIRNCRFENNEGYGIASYTQPLSSRSVDLDVVFENCYVTSDKGSGITLMAVNEDGPGGSIEFKNCTIENVAQTGLLVYNKAADRAGVTFQSCMWKNVAYNMDTTPFIIGLWKDRGVSTIGGITFTGCLVEDARDRPFLSSILAETTQRIEGIRGDIKVKNPHGARMELGDSASGITLDVKE